LKKPVDVSIILSAYNEEEIIGRAIKKVDNTMKETDWSYEIIVVDDGSNDNTKFKANNSIKVKGKNQFKVISYSKNKGKGNAIKEGFKQANGKYIVLIDSDLEINPMHIPRYLSALKKNDIAIASKWNQDSLTNYTLKRKILSIGFNVLSRLFTGIKIRDTQTGLKVLRRNVLKRVGNKLSINRYAFDLELIAACNHCGFKIVDLPVDVHVEGTIGFNEILRMARDMCKIAYRLRVLKYYQRT
jgi:glycosyltransferase involved in cell wall biosynthesis